MMGLNQVLHPGQAALGIISKLQTAADLEPLLQRKAAGHVDVHVGQRTRTRKRLFSDDEHGSVEPKVRSDLGAVPRRYNRGWSNDGVEPIRLVLILEGLFVTHREPGIPILSGSIVSEF